MLSAGYFKIIITLFRCFKLLRTMLNIRVIVACACLALSMIELQAQTVTGSVYSYFGVGNLQGRTSAYNRAMGYGGIALRDEYNLSAVNPAAYNSTVRPFTAFFELGANYESVSHTTDASATTSRAGGLN